MRRLTIVVDIEQPQANWLWEKMMLRMPINGLHVWKMGDGDLTVDNL